MKRDDYYSLYVMIAFCQQQSHLVSYPNRWGNVSVHEYWTTLREIFVVVYYESIKRELQTRPIYECRY
jgi:hypothetical protein